MVSRGLLFLHVLLHYVFIVSAATEETEHGLNNPSIHLFNFEVHTSYNANGRRIISINGEPNTYGPVLRVLAGDTINLSLKNAICSATEVIQAEKDPILKEYCETGLHFHGLTPIGNKNDGVPGFTQRAILPGETYWYNFTVPTETCGTFWYHSHSAVQYGDGFRGVFIVECDRYTSAVDSVFQTVKEMQTISDGPLEVKDTISTEPVSYDEQIITLSDWYSNWDLDVSKSRVLSFDSTTDPSFDQSLFNGLEDNNIKLKLESASEGVVLRIINSGMSGTQVFHVADHKLIILETDGILVKPYSVDTLSIAVGQRYTVVIKFHDKSLKEGVRIVNGCNKMMGYVEKNGWLVKDSTESVDMSSHMSVKSVPGLNKHEMFRDLEPTLPLYADKKGLWEQSDLKTIALDYEYFSDPSTLQEFGTGMYKMNGKTLGEYVKDPIVFEADQVVQIVINSVDHMRHPWHLHGHPFQLVSIGTGGEGALDLNNLNNAAGSKYKSDIEFWKSEGRIPMTRDSINIPGRSYAAIRIIADKPGFWLLHCHIDWHVQKGLGVAFHELAPRSLTDSADFTESSESSPKSTSESVESSQNTEIQPEATKEPINNNPDDLQPSSSRGKVLAIYFFIMIMINCIIYRVIM